MSRQDTANHLQLLFAAVLSEAVFSVAQVRKDKKTRIKDKVYIYLVDLSFITVF